MNDLVLYTKTIAVMIVATFGVCGCVLGVGEAVKLFAMLFICALYASAFCLLSLAIFAAYFEIRSRKHEGD